MHLVRCLMDEIFGSENFVSLITFRKKLMPLGAKTLENMCDYLIWYGNDKERIKYHQLYVNTEPEAPYWRFVELPNGIRRPLEVGEIKGRIPIPIGAKVYTTVSQLAPSYSESGVYDFNYEGKNYRPPSGQCWLTTPDKMNVLVQCNRLQIDGQLPRFILYHDDFPYQKLTNPWLDTAGAMDKIYVIQTNTKVIERCLLMTTDPGDLVLDPTCGSGTTAYVAEQWGRRWITIDTSRVALALARTRLMSARFPYYLLADSPEGIKKEAELTGRMPHDYKTEADIKKGFVYKRVPHITLKSIANNPDIREGMTREEIGAAIARYAETETLYDLPYDDNKRIRVTGPFTVESLSPHRVIAMDEERPTAETQAQKEAGAGQFETMILDNLKKAGVQNTIRNERLKFDWLEPYAGEWLHAAGEYTEKDGTARRVAICIGPEHGTVGAELVKEAAKEAVKGVGFDLLIVCGFAFDPHVSEEARRYGKLNVLVTRMNPDLSMGDELLKKTGAGNLFMVFGELDVDIREREDGKVVVEIKGVDVYDPTTGQIRSSSTDDIACWFIDTDYNEESFFVCHAYFTGANEPYEKLKRALKAEIDQAAWSSLYSTVSRPFDVPKTGKIAIKVINHYGDEVLKVYEVS